MKKLILAAAALLMLSGCSYNADVAAYNDKVMAANSGEKLEFAAALSACGDNAACQVGVSMAFASNMGETPFMKPETLSDQVRAWIPAASLALQGIDMFYGGVSGTGSAGYVVTGDNNTFSGNGNNLESTGGSTLSSPFSSSNNFSWSTNNKDYSLGSGYDGTVVDSGVTGDLAEVPVAEVTE